MFTLPMLFTRDNLSSDHYKWEHAAGVIPYAGDPRRRIFDRFNGEHVLFLINAFGSSIGKLSLTSGRKLEDLIHRELPLEVRSELAAFNWLRGVYLYYSH